MNSWWSKLILETISKNMKDKKVIGGNHHGFRNGKSCLTNVIAFCNYMISLVGDGRTLDGVYLDFRKAFDTVSHNISIYYVAK